MINSLWKFFTSLRLTVVCLGLGMLIVFFGTIAQVDLGLWASQKRWFQSWGVYGHLNVLGFLPNKALLLPWIFPGGYLVGSVTLVNLISAHIKRFQWSAKKVGIHLAHAGIILLLCGQLLTDQLSRESLMSLREGQGRVYSESHRENELVFASDFDASREEVVSIPGESLAHKKEITHAKLPFTVRVKEYQPNGELTSRSSLAKTGTQLTTALGTLEAQYATAEGLPAQAERALENGGGGREAVWKASLKALGQPAKGDLVALATTVSKDPALSARLNAELKKRFREQMIERFAKADPAQMHIPSTEATAMHIAAAQILKGAPASPEAFSKIATNDSGNEAIIRPLEEATDMNSRNMPYAVIEIVDAGASKGTWVVTPWLNEQEITVGGRTFRMAFRFERYYQPFSVQLQKVTHEIYPGTVTAADPEGIPKNYQSRVEIKNPDKGERREVDIYMNNPLRYGGLTFYQYQMGSDEIRGSAVGTSTFQVVKNPSWVTPYLGCFLVGGGLMYQFLMHLFSFMGKRLGMDKPLPTPPNKKPREARTAQPVS